MELKEIKQLARTIVEAIDSREKRLYYCKYETFLSWFEMSLKRNFGTLKKVDFQLQKFGVTIWNAQLQVKSVTEFKRGETITFRKPLVAKRKKVQKKLTKPSNLKGKFGGSIKIKNEESGLVLYKHQEDAIENLEAQIIRPQRSSFEGLLVLPTGGGKTLVAAFWLAKNFIDKNKKILWIAHRHELLEQAKNTFQDRIPYSDIIKNRTSFNYRIISGIHDKPSHIHIDDDLIISSKDSLNGGISYLKKNWLHGNKDIILIVDEAHHATAKSYRKLIGQLKKEVDSFKMIGLTATPSRTALEEQGLLGKVFPDNIIYKVDLRTLISRAILSEPIFEEVNTQFDMTRVLTDDQLENLKYFDIETIGKGSAKTIAENDTRNWIIVNRYLNNREKYKQTIVFALNQDNAIALKKLFTEAGILADFVISSLKDTSNQLSLSRKENSLKIERFRKGELEVLINVNILTEGTDLPNVQSVFLARPTISTILMTQMIGRGLRGELAGGTKEAYIVSFIDDWKDKVSWINPEKLIIEENADFNDRNRESNHQLIRLVSLSKIEEFAILTNKILDKVAKEQLEKLNFIERIPLGIYHFSILISNGKEEHEKNCEVLVYNNLNNAYFNFVSNLKSFFEDNRITEKDYLIASEMEHLAQVADNRYFTRCEKYPGYSLEDIKDILQYYAQNEVTPKYIELKDREKYDLTKIASEILMQDLGRKEEEEFKNAIWENNEVEWKAFFGYDKRYFLNEIDLVIRKLINPELYR